MLTAALYELIGETTVAETIAMLHLDIYDYR